MNIEISKFPNQTGTTHFPPEIAQKYSGSLFLTKPSRQRPSFILRYGPDGFDVLDANGSLSIASFSATKELEEDVMMTAATGFFINDQLRIMAVVQRYAGSYGLQDSFDIISYDPWTLEKEVIAENGRGSVQSLVASHFSSDKIEYILAYALLANNTLVSFVHSADSEVLTIAYQSSNRSKVIICHSRPQCLSPKITFLGQAQSESIRAPFALVGTTDGKLQVLRPSILQQKLDVVYEVSVGSAPVTSACLVALNLYVGFGSEMHTAGFFMFSAPTESHKQPKLLDKVFAKSEGSLANLSVAKGDDGQSLVTSLVHHKDGSSLYTYEVQANKIHPIFSTVIDIESSTRAVGLSTDADSLESSTLLFANKVATVYYARDEEEIDFSELHFHSSEWFHVSGFPYNQSFQNTIQKRRSEFGQLFVDKLLQVCGVREAYPPVNMGAFQKIIESLLASEIDDLQKFSIILYFLKDWKSNHQDRFCSSYLLPKSFCHVISGYWALDHGDTKQGLIHLSQPSVLLDWVDHVMFALGDQAVEFGHVYPEHRKTDEMFEALLKKDLVQAFYHQRNCDVKDGFVKLLTEIDKRSGEVAKLSLMPFSVKEEARFLAFKPKSRQFLAYQFIYLTQRGRYVEALQRAARLSVEKEMIDLIISLVPVSERKSVEELMSRETVFVESTQDIDMSAAEIEQTEVVQMSQTDQSAEPSYLAMEYVHVEAEPDSEVIEISSDSDVIMIDDEEIQLDSQADTVSIISSEQMVSIADVSEIQMGSPVLDREDLPSLLLEDDFMEEDVSVESIPLFDKEDLPEDEVLQLEEDVEKEEISVAKEQILEDTGNVTEVEVMNVQQPEPKSSPLKEIAVASPQRKSPRRKKTEKSVSPSRPLSNTVPPLVNMSPFSPPLLRKKKLVEIENPTEPAMTLTPKRARAKAAVAEETEPRTTGRRTRTRKAAILLEEINEKPDETGTPLQNEDDDGLKIGGRKLRNTPARLKKSDSVSSITEAFGTPTRKTRKSQLATTPAPLTAERRTRSGRLAGKHD